MRAAVGGHRNGVAALAEAADGFVDALNAQIRGFHHQVGRVIGAGAFDLAIEFIDVDDEAAEQELFRGGGAQTFLRGDFGGGQPGDAGADNDKVKTGCRHGSLLVNFHEWMTRRPQPQRPDMTGWGRIGF